MDFNPELESIEALGGVQYFGGGIGAGGEKLKSFRGLEGAVNLKSLSLGGPLITSLDGLQNLESVEGNVGISRTKIKSLEELRKLSHIGGDLNFQLNDSLISLSGLENLNELKGDLEVLENASLPNFIGLGKIDSVRELRIQNNPSLISLEGLESIDFVKRIIEISKNEKLATLQGLENVREIVQSFFIYENKSLKTIDHLDNLEKIGWHFTIRENDSLVTIPRIQKLDSIGGDLTIRFNDFLRNLKGFESLRYIRRNLEIGSCNSLVSLSGLENLQAIGDGNDWNGNLTISGNLGLRDLEGMGSNVFNTLNHLFVEINLFLTICNSADVCTYLTNGGVATISRNMPGCNDVDEVLASCENLSKIAYRIFYDLNGSGIQDPEEETHGDGGIRVEPGEKLYFSNLEDEGILFLKQGNYTIHYNENALPDWELTTDSASYHLNVDGAFLSDTLYFGVQPTSQFSELKTFANSPKTRCFFDAIFDVRAKNTGTTLLSGIMWLDIAEIVDYVQFISPPDTMLSSDVYGWRFDSLFPGKQIVRRVNVGIPGPNEFGIGGPMPFPVFAEYFDGTELFQSDTFDYSPRILCAWDPNDKLVHPNREGDYTLFEEDLLYTVRFQNTGNDFAHDIILRDTLDENLDPTTFQFMSTSHPGNLSITLEDDRFLSFEFNNIYLPDSTLDFDGSQGYVSYLISPNPGLLEETEIHNSASIYFDRNPPIVTNTTRNLMVSELPTSSVTDVSEKPFNLFPNPTNGKVFLKNPPKEIISIEVFNQTGQLIFEFENSIESGIDFSDFPEGVYFLKIHTGSGVFVERVLKF